MTKRFVYDELVERCTPAHSDCSFKGRFVKQKQQRLFFCIFAVVADVVGGVRGDPYLLQVEQFVYAAAAMIIL